MSAKKIEPFYTELGRSIQAQRVRLGLSQESLGAALRPRVTRASIANIEAGKQRILTHTLVQLAEALNTEITQLIPEKESVLKALAPTRLEAQLAEHKVPTKTIKRLRDQLSLSRNEK